MQGQYPLPSSAFCKQTPGYIVSNAFSALLLSAGQLTVTPDSSQRSTRVKGEKRLKSLQGVNAWQLPQVPDWLFKHLMLCAGAKHQRTRGWKVLNLLIWETEGNDSVLTVMEMKGWGGHWVHYHSWNVLVCPSTSLSVLTLEPQPTPSPPSTESWWLFDSVAGRQMPPRPAETFMRPHDPLLHLMYPNRPLWLLSSLAPP